MPRLMVVGTGRCGTKSLAALYQTNQYQAEHEPNKNPVVFLASAYSHGWINATGVAATLDRFDWPDIVVDYKQSELISVTADLWPETQYLWLTRNKADTVASMIRHRWYLPADDAYPPGYLGFYQQIDGRMADQTIHNQAGNRTRGDMVGTHTGAEWAALDQASRCEWWWDWVNTRIDEQFLQVDPTRVDAVRLEDVSSEGFGEWLTGEPVVLPHV